MLEKGPLTSGSTKVEKIKHLNTMDMQLLLIGHHFLDLSIVSSCR
jgi:hypothetical protein